MSKNERLLRTLIAGVVFAAIGVLAVEYDEQAKVAKHSRGPASEGCATEACQKIEAVKSGLLGARAKIMNAHGLDPKEKAPIGIQLEIHKAEDVKLQEAGALFAALFHDRSPADYAPEEITEVALFLFDSFELDGGGIVLDALEVGTDEARANEVVRKVIDQIEPQSATSRMSPPALVQTFRASLNAFLDETAEPVPAKKR